MPRAIKARELSRCSRAISWFISESSSFLMAIVAGQSLQHHGAGLRQVDLIDSLMHRASQQTLNARVIGQFEKTAHHLQQVLADPSGVLRLAEPVAEHQGWLIAADQRDQRRGIKGTFPQQSGRGCRRCGLYCVE